MLWTHTQSYEQAFEKIKKATGITDIDQLVSKFIDGQLTSTFDNYYFHAEMVDMIITVLSANMENGGGLNLASLWGGEDRASNDSEYVDYIAGECSADNPQE